MLHLAFFSSLPILSLLLLVLLLLTGVSEAATFTLLNSCTYPIWPGILSNAGISPLSTTGFALLKGESKSITTPSNWGGRFWARTHCTTNATTNAFSCLTADCSTNQISCSGSGATPPATLAEFTLSGSSGLDFFDVSLVDGYNLPMLVTPHSGSKCSMTGCIEDLNEACPGELRVGGENGVVACKSACEAFGTPEYCCSGEYGGPETCKASRYSMVFKKACPTAYSYAYDDKTSTFTCGGSPDYTITFCPSPATSQKAASTEGEGEQPSSSSSSPSDIISNGSMVYEGALYDSSSPSTRLPSQIIAVGIAILTATCQLRHLI